MSAPKKPLPSWFRRTARHFGFFTLGTLIIGLITQIGTGYFSPTETMSLGAAYAGFFFLCATLLIGPIRVLQGRPLPVSSTLRRDLGIWSGVFAILHTYVGLFVYPAGGIANYFISKPNPGMGAAIRYDLFGIANYLGLLAVVIFLPLLLLSNNKSLTWLKARRWKSIQRWAYAAGILTMIHGLAYQFYEGRSVYIVAALLIVSLGVLTLQAKGYFSRRVS